MSTAAVDPREASHRYLPQVSEGPFQKLIILSRPLDLFHFLLRGSQRRMKRYHGAAVPIRLKAKLIGPNALGQGHYLLFVERNERSQDERFSCSVYELQIEHYLRGDLAEAISCGKRVVTMTPGELACNLHHEAAEKEKLVLVSLSQEGHVEMVVRHGEELDLWLVSRQHSCQPRDLTLPNLFSVVEGMEVKQVNVTSPLHREECSHRRVYPAREEG